MLALDLGVFHHRAHAVSTKEALAWSIVWTTLALVFAGLLYAYCSWKFPADPRLSGSLGSSQGSLAWQITLEYLTGFIIEKTLALDNIFVFVLIFEYFVIPATYQHRVLFFGVLGALLFRIIFIALGAVLLQHKAIVVAFGVVLVLTGAEILLSPAKPIDPEANLVIRLLRRLVPITPELKDQHFFRRVATRLHGTPLLVALAFIEISDIIFAVDSVPAIFSITHEPLIVFTSNVFAIMGLRALYFALAGIVYSYMRMYWAKKLLEWSPSVATAYQRAVWLNDRYELDGRDPTATLALLGSTVQCLDRCDICRSAAPDGGSTL